MVIISALLSILNLLHFILLRSVLGNMETIINVIEVLNK